MQTLTVIILTMLVLTSFAIAQSDEGEDSRLLARADIEIGKILTEREASREISHFVKNDLNPKESPDQSYESPSLKAEDMPLVMSSADKRTMSVVIPPFLYFRTQF